MKDMDDSRSVPDEEVVSKEFMVGRLGDFQGGLPADFPLQHEAELPTLQLSLIWKMCIAVQYVLL